MNKQWELSPDKFLTKNEVGKLLNRSDELWILGEVKNSRQLIRDSIIIKTALMTGLRCSEICNLKVEDFKISNGESYLIVTNGKGHKRRVVHFGKEYKKDVKRYLKWKEEHNEICDGAYFLKSERSENYTSSALWRRWKKYCPNGKTLHSARHTNATLVYQASGNNLRMVQRQLGHSRITTTQIYADVMPELMFENMCSMEKMTKQLCKSCSA